MKADDAYATGLETAMAMAGIALHVKNAALDLLAQELHALRRENELLVKVATASGGDQVTQLLLSLHHTEAELDQANQRLQEEVEIREGLERELEDTAAAAQELWESMQAACSEAPDSCLQSRAHSTQGSDVEGSEDQWGTPSGAASPLSASAADMVAVAGAAAAMPDASQQQQHPSTPRTAVTAAIPADTAAAARSSTPEARHHATVAGILTPLESKLQCLSSKLTGLVAWLDTRDADSPASTPRGRLGRQSPSPAARHGSSSRTGAAYHSASPLAVSSPRRSPGPAAAAAVGKLMSDCGSTSPLLDGLLDAGDNLPQQLRAKLAAAAAGLADKGQRDRHHAVDGVAQLKLSPRGGLATGGSTVPAAAADGAGLSKAVAASLASEAQQGDVHSEKDA